MNLYTIGFTKKTAKQFFELLKRNNVKRLVDTRLNTKSQLAGFAKKDDLEYFLKEITNIEYLYQADFAPTEVMLKGYKGKAIGWDEYAREYLNLLNNRNILKKIDIKSFEDACFLCSEDSPQYCHRRLLSEYISENNKGVRIIHLK